jgi:quercetin dioxygenase-like cupin family protein
MKNLRNSKIPRRKVAAAAAPATAPLPDIGQSLRARRRQLGLSIVEVAQSSQLSNGYISLLERNLASPSITALMRIGEVLGLPLHHFLQLPETGGHHFPRSARTPFQLARGGMRFDRISGQFTGSVMNALVVTIPPQHKSSPVMHPGEELVYVLGGNLRFTLGGRAVLMEQGDSVHLPSTTPHGWENPFTEEATVMWVGTAPLFQHDADLKAAGEDLKLHGSPTGIPLHQAIASHRARHA